MMQQPLNVKDGLSLLGMDDLVSGAGVEQAVEYGKLASKIGGDRKSPYIFKKEGPKMSIAFLNKDPESIKDMISGLKESGDTIGSIYYYFSGNKLHKIGYKKALSMLGLFLSKL